MLMRGHEHHEISEFFQSNFEPSEWATKRDTFIHQMLQDSGFTTTRAGRGVLERIMHCSLVRIEQVTNENIPLLNCEEDSALSQEERVIKIICKLISNPPPSSNITDLGQMVIKHCFPMVLLSAIDLMSTYVMDTFVVDAETGLVIGI